MSDGSEPPDERRRALRGLVHDLENDLSAIRLFSEVVRTEVVESPGASAESGADALVRALAQIDDAAARATRTAHELLRVASEPPPGASGAPPASSPEPVAARTAPGALGDGARGVRPVAGSLGAGRAGRAEAASDAYARVLCVEDNPANARLVERLFGYRAGIELVLADCGADALVEIERARFDLVLLDLNLPDIPGEELLALLHASPLGATTPVVVLSADATEQQKDRLRAAGATRYLTKPFDLGEFFSLVDAICPPPPGAG